MVSKKERREAEEYSELQEDVTNLSEDSMDRDFDRANNGNNYVSDVNPTDIYQYKKMRLVPNSESDFQGLIDKDVVLANVGDEKPDPRYLRFMAETIVAMDVFSTKVEIDSTNAKGDRIPIYNDKGLLVGYEKEVFYVPDPQFDVIRSFLKASYKADLTLSRAMGKDREAVLDRTQNIGKEIKKNNQSNNKYN